MKFEEMIEDIKKRFSEWNDCPVNLNDIEFESSDSDSDCYDGLTRGYFSYQYSYTDLKEVENVKKEKIIKEQLKTIEAQLRKQAGID